MRVGGGTAVGAQCDGWGTAVGAGQFKSSVVPLKMVCEALHCRVHLLLYVSLVPVNDSAKEYSGRTSRCRR